MTKFDPSVAVAKTQNVSIKLNADNLRKVDELIEKSTGEKLKNGPKRGFLRSRMINKMIEFALNSQ